MTKIKNLDAQSDLRKLEAMHLSQALEAKQIRNLNSVSADQITEWYDAVDPLQELRAKKALEAEVDVNKRNNYFEIICERADYQRTLAIGGACLIQDCIMPGFMQLSDYDKLQVFERIAENYAIFTEDIGYPRDAQSVARKYDNEWFIDIALKQLDDNVSFVITEDSVRQLLYAGDMFSDLSDSAFEWKYFAREPGARVPKELSAERSNKVAVKVYDIVAGIPENFGVNNIEVSNLALNACQHLSDLLHHEFEQQGSILKTMQKKGLQTPVKYSEIWKIGDKLGVVSNITAKSLPPETVVRPELFDRLKRMGIQILIDSIEKEFIGGSQKGRLYDNSLPKSEVKGKLYEMVWQLDFIALSLLSSNGATPRYRPASTACDAPKNGHPTLKRGYDGRVYSVDKVLQLVQLKSSARAVTGKGKYHPKIKVVYDDNFMDANPKRLYKKLAIYKRVFDTGNNITVEDELQVHQMLLSSARQEYDAACEKQDKSVLGSALSSFALTHYGEIPPLESREISFPFQGINREQRRKLQKQIKKR